ncbi:YtxH domain-containing protein [Aureivirga marina]|uniref:YtxH domain-containing protein n=1 Tax=Aureivirga marina TaxID=1182451 RepID=UPI0018C95017|nr:YtxH domain-containing protein [Aureivirga marina]
MSNTGNTILGVLVGGAIGATLGILFAPEKGSKTRQMIKDEVNHSKDDILNKVSHLKETIEEKVFHKNGTLGSKIEEIITESSIGTNDAITALEKKLEELRKRNKKTV